MLQDSNTILIFLSALVIFSYLVDELTKKIKFPAVIILIFTGVGLQYAAKFLELPAFDLSGVLPVLGTLGLIIIVLEGALEIRFDGTAGNIMGIAALSGFVILLVTTTITAFILQYISGFALYDCFLNAIPISVVSSAVAISAAKSLPKKTRIFVTYESTFSDIYGIIFFNFILNNDVVNAEAFGMLGMELVVLSIASVTFSFFILYLLKQVNSHTRFFFIIAVLILTYGIAKSAHLPALFIVLVLGLFLNNADLIKWRFVKKHLVFDGIKREMENLHQFSAEMAFITKTFFFIVFGYTIHLEYLSDLNILVYGTVILCMGILIRAIVLWLLPKRNLNPELFMLPRGLISILLFLGIPEASRIPAMGNGIVLFVIIASGLFMASGLIAYKSDAEIH